MPLVARLGFARGLLTEQQQTPHAPNINFELSSLPPPPRPIPRPLPIAYCLLLDFNSKDEPPVQSPIVSTTRRARCSDRLWGLARGVGGQKKTRLVDRTQQVPAVSKDTRAAPQHPEIRRLGSGSTREHSTRARIRQRPAVSALQRN